jgi:hypothetical protein
MESGAITDPAFFQGVSIMAIGTATELSSTGNYIYFASFLHASCVLYASCVVHASCVLHASFVVHDGTDECSCSGGTSFEGKYVEGVKHGSGIFVRRGGSHFTESGDMLQKAANAASIAAVVAVAAAFAAAQTAEKMEPQVLEQWRATVAQRLLAFRARESQAVAQMRVAAAIGMGASAAAEQVLERTKVVRQWVHDNKHQYLFTSGEAAIS